LTLSFSLIFFHFSYLNLLLRLNPVSLFSLWIERKREKQRKRTDNKKKYMD